MTTIALIALCLIGPVATALAFGLCRAAADLQPVRPDEGEYESQAK